MSTTIPITDNKTNGNAVILMPPTAGERVLAKLLGEAEESVRELRERVSSLEAANCALLRKNQGLCKGLEHQMTARQRYEDLYLEEHHRTRQLTQELRGRWRMPSWVADLGRFFADVQDAWVPVSRGLSGLRKELRIALSCLQGQKG